MPQVTTTVTPTIVEVPLQGAMTGRGPRSEVRFKSTQVAIAAPGAGNNQYIDFVGSLGVGYAHSLIDFQFRIYEQSAGVGAVNFGTIASVVWADAVTFADRNYTVPMHAFNNGPMVTAAGLVQRMYNARGGGQGNLTNAILRPALPVEQCFLGMSIYNPTANDQAYYLDYFARFYRWQIEESFNRDASYAQATR